MADSTASGMFTDSLNRAIEKVYQLRMAAFQSAPGGDMDTGLRGLDQELREVQRLSKDMVNQQSHLHELIRTFALLNSSLEVDVVLEDMMDTLIVLTGAERVYLLMHDADSGELTVRKARNRGRADAGDVTFSRSIVDQAIKEGKPILIDNALDDERYNQSASVMLLALRSILCIPLMRRGETIGVLYADNRLGQGLFTKDSLPLLSAFANQASIAIENARLFSQVRADLEVAQQEVRTLLIKFDQAKVAREVDSITSTDYFRALQEMAQEKRRAAGK
jgi:adenylate cyclase